jgi:putative transposase
LLKAFKYRIFPTESQKEVLAKTFGCVRFTYNYGLQEKIKSYKETGKAKNCFKISGEITKLKKEKEWLAEPPSQALQGTLRSLDNAFTAFYRKQNAFPKFKSRNNRQSFQLPQGVKIDFENNKIFLPKLKEVTCIFSRKFKGQIKTTTVSKTPAGSYFVSILVQNNQTLPEKKEIKKQTSVGVDVGIKNFAITSDNQIFENQKFLTRNLKRLRIEQRSLSRKVKGSQNRNKQRIIVAKLHEKITNQRNDYLHKISHYLVSNYDTICFETLNISGMVKNRHLAKAISEQGWAKLMQFTKYKADWNGKNVIHIGQFKPSSRIDSECGCYNHELKLSDRTWICPSCKRVVDRDLNAAINIRDFGLGQKPLPANVDAFRSSVGQESHLPLGVRVVNNFA